MKRIGCIDKIQLDNEVGYINRYFSMNPSHVIGDLSMVEAYGKPVLTCRASMKSDTFLLLRRHLYYFPPQNLPTLEACKSSLAQGIISIDKEIQALSSRKKQLMQSQRDLQSMERQFLLQCVEKFNLDSGALVKLG